MVRPSSPICGGISRAALTRMGTPLTTGRFRPSSLLFRARRGRLPFVLQTRSDCQLLPFPGNDTAPLCPLLIPAFQFVHLIWMPCRQVGQFRAIRPARGTFASASIGRHAPRQFLRVPRIEALASGGPQRKREPGVPIVSRPSFAMKTRPFTRAGTCPHPTACLWITSSVAGSRQLIA